MPILPSVIGAGLESRSVSPFLGVVLLAGHVRCKGELCSRSPITRTGSHIQRLVMAGPSQRCPPQMSSDRAYQSRDTRAPDPRFACHLGEPHWMSDLLYLCSAAAVDSSEV